MSGAVRPSTGRYRSEQRWYCVSCVGLGLVWCPDCGGLGRCRSGTCVQGRVTCAECSGTGLPKREGW